MEAEKEIEKFKHEKIQKAQDREDEKKKVISSSPIAVRFSTIEICVFWLFLQNAHAYVCVCVGANSKNVGIINFNS